MTPMTRFRWLCLWVPFTLTLLGPARATPLEAYGRLPSIEQVAISPDGQKFAIVTTTSDARLVAVARLADNALIKTMRVGDQKLRRVEWADDDRLMITTSVTGMPMSLTGEDTEWSLLQVIDLRNGDDIPIPNLNRRLNDPELMNVLSGEVMVRHIDGHTVLFVPGVYLDHYTMRCLIRYDLDTKRQSIVTLGKPDTLAWFVDSSGDIIADGRYDQDTGRWSMRIAQDGHLTEVASGKEAIDVPLILGYGPGENTLLVQFVTSGNRPATTVYLA